MAKPTSKEELGQGRSNGRMPGHHSRSNPNYTDTGHGRKGQARRRRLRALDRYELQLKTLDPKDPANMRKIASVKDQVSTLRWKLENS